MAEIEKYKGGILWQATHKSFDEYVRERFNYKPQHVGRLLSAGNLTLQLKSETLKPEDLPTNEAQLRPLLNKLPQSHHLQAWKKVVADLKPEERTGAKVMAKVQEIRKAIPKDELAASKPETPEELIQKLVNITSSHHHGVKIRAMLIVISRLFAEPKNTEENLSTVDNQTSVL